MHEFFSSMMGKLIVVTVVLAVSVFAIGQCTRAEHASTRAELGEGQAEVASENAADAVGAIGDVAGRASDSDQQTRSNADAIDDAEGSDAPVNPAVRDAGLNSLCGRAAYRDSQECLQRAAAQ